VIADGAASFYPNYYAIIRPNSAAAQGAYQCKVTLQTPNGPFIYWSDPLNLQFALDASQGEALEAHVTVTNEIQQNDSQVWSECTISINPLNLNYRVSYRINDTILGEYVVDGKPELFGKNRN